MRKMLIYPVVLALGGTRTVIWSIILSLELLPRMIENKSSDWTPQGRWIVIEAESGVWGL